jgi:hypothetical protein
MGGTLANCDGGRAGMSHRTAEKHWSEAPAHAPRRHPVLAVSLAAWAVVQAAVSYAVLSIAWRNPWHLVVLDRLAGSLGLFVGLEVTVATVLLVYAAVRLVRGAAPDWPFQIIVAGAAVAGLPLLGLAVLSPVHEPHAPDLHRSVSPGGRYEAVLRISYDSSWNDYDITVRSRAGRWTRELEVWDQVDKHPPDVRFVDEHTLEITAGQGRTDRVLIHGNLSVSPTYCYQSSDDGQQAEPCPT